MAQSAVSAIKSGCQLLSEGRQEIAGFKKGVEQTIGDAKAIYGEITGLFGWFKGLFGIKAKPASVSAKPVVASDISEKRVAKTVKQKHVKEPEQSYEEYKIQLINTTCEHLKTFFEIRRKLNEHCHELEEQSKTTENIEDSAIDRVSIKMQLEDMTTQIRETMTTYAPPELKGMYTEFLKMYELILEEQAFARQEKRKRDRDAAWQREYRLSLITAKVGYAVVVTLVYLEMVGLYLGLSSNTGW